ncbi:terminase small subunit [Xanthobacter flavus]|uniref:terminase small subunit n=1 Tax=Xanthobacter flavus TaxID=281 RepID=UPI00372A6D7C
MLTKKQAEFVREYLVDLNATQAAIRAGYSKRTARFMAAENLAKPNIAAAVEAAMAERAARTEITADRVLRELAKLAFFDIRKAFRPDGSLKPLNEMDDETAASIAGLEVSEFTDGDGGAIGYLKKIKIADKRAALVDIGRHLGMWNDKLTLKGDAENPMTVFIKQMQGTSIQPVDVVPEELPALVGRH